MDWLIGGGALVGLLTAIPRLREGGWRQLILPGVWIAVLIPAFEAFHSSVIQLVGIVVMVVGAWWLGECSKRRFPVA